MAHKAASPAALSILDNPPAHPGIYSVLNTVYIMNTYDHHHAFSGTVSVHFWHPLLCQASLLLIHQHSKERGLFHQLMLCLMCGCHLLNCKLSEGAGDCPIPLHSQRPGESAHVAGTQQAPDKCSLINGQVNISTVRW